MKEIEKPTPYDAIYYPIYMDMDSEGLAEIEDPEQESISNGILLGSPTAEEEFPIQSPSVEDLKRAYAADGERLMKSNEEGADWVTSDMKDRSEPQGYEEEHRDHKDLLKKIQALPEKSKFLDYLDRATDVSNVDLLKYLWQTAQTACEALQGPGASPTSGVRNVERLLRAMQVRIENHTDYHEDRLPRG